MIRIAIVDDDCYLSSHVERVLLAYNRISTYDFEIEVFNSGYDLFQYLEEEQNFDLIFLDIEMEGCNGVEIGRILRDEQKDNITQIVYITACDGYERQLFQIRPMNFLEKPLSSSMIVGEVEKYIELFAGMEQLFSFTCQRKNLKIPYKDIIYFRSDDKKIEIWVSYDNRRLMAAQNAGLNSIPVSIVNGSDCFPGRNYTWEHAFNRRFNDPRNVPPVPYTGLNTQPTIVGRK